MSAFSYAGTNPLLLLLNTIYYSNPLVFYAFIGIVVLAAAITYLENIRAGLVATILVSAFFYWVGLFLPYVYIPLIAGLVLLFLDVFGLADVKREIENFVNWLYLLKVAKKPKR
ncbi:MAG: hypothetical protein M1573_02140 [Candidatus Parvarchaeota archaeon]|nr:hypothetical protein [Candidatus Parvarchaeota archaeon]